MRTKLKTIGFEIEAEWGNELLEQRDTGRTVTSTTYSGSLGDSELVPIIHTAPVLSHRFLELFKGSFHTDGSIDTCSKCRSKLRAVEYNSPVFKVEELPEITKVFEHLHTFVEKKEYHWNSSCGFHIHTGFGGVMPFELVSEDFYKFFERRMKRLLPEEYKKRASNNFCSFKPEPNSYRPWREQARSTEEVFPSTASAFRAIILNGSRYHAINMLPSFHERKTIEFRIFPSEEPLKMLSYLQFTIDSITEFLDKDRKRDYPYYIASVVNDNPIISTKVVDEESIPNTKLYEYENYWSFHRAGSSKYRNGDTLYIREDESRYIRRNGDWEPSE